MWDDIGSTAVVPSRDPGNSTVGTKGLRKTYMVDCRCESWGVGVRTGVGAGG